MLRILRVCRWLVARLPVWLGRWLACRAGDVAYYLATRGRRAAISNMRHVLGPGPPGARCAGPRTRCSRMWRWTIMICCGCPT